MAQTWRVCTGTIQSHCGAVAPSAVSLSCTNVSSCASLKTSYLPETKRKTPFYVNWKSFFNVRLVAPSLGKNRIMLVTRNLHR